MTEKAKYGSWILAFFGVFFLSGCGQPSSSAPVAPAAASPLAPESYAEVIERLRPLVVSIEGELAAIQNDPLALLQRLADTQSRNAEQAASGLLVSPQGHIATTYRWAEASAKLLVRVNDLPPLEASVVGRDRLTGIAVLKIDAEGLPTVTWPEADQAPQVGELCLALGNLGGMGMVPSLGMIASTDWTAEIAGSGAGGLILANVMSSASHAGGGLFSVSGNFLGILLPTAMFSDQATPPISFALPAQEVRYVVETLIEQGRVPRGFLGIRTRDFHPEIDLDAGHPGEKGALVAGLAAASPATEAGLEVNDVIISVNGSPITSAVELTRQIQRQRPGDQIVLTHIRKGQRLETQVVLGDLPAQ